MVKAPKLATKLPAQKQQQFNQMVDTWKRSKPLNINALKKAGTITVDTTDPELKITKIQSADFIYNG